MEVGGRAAVGQFQLIRPIKVLDLTVFDEPSPEISMFEANYRDIIAYGLFLESFHREIRKPVLQRDEAIDYIPTQVISEFFAHEFEPNLDGIIYSSSQTDGEGRNIVLFNRSAVIEDTTANLKA